MTDTGTGDRERTGQQEPLFTTRRPTWQRLLWLVLGGATIVVGLVTAVTDATSGEPGATTMAITSLIVFGGFGALLLLLGAALRGSVVEGFDDRLEVRKGLGRRRTVRATDIARLDQEVVASKARSWPTIVARDERGRKLFQAVQGYPGSADLAAWLRTHRAQEWAAFAGADERW